MKCIKLKLFVLVTYILSFCICLISCSPVRENGSKHYDPSQNTTTFKNPISPNDAADPFITYDCETGYYYGLFTLGDRLEIYRSRHVGNIITGGDSKVVYAANENDGIYGNIWAPEMHKGNDGKWYIYTSGTTDPTNEEKHLFVVQAETSDPFGEWNFISVITPDIYCIDPTLYTASDEKQYLCYSRVDNEYGQVLEICEMISPYLCSQKRVTIAKAELDWECVSPYNGKHSILEGAFFLEKNNRLFIIYSANGCWSDHYALGVLLYVGGDICDANSWKKLSEPLLTYGNGVYGPGHASFFESPDGTEIWCAYHGMKSSNDTLMPATRYLNIQKVEFNLIGFPVMGKPIGYETEIFPPSGEKSKAE